MKAIILAGGRGSRMKNLTDNIPKPLVKVAGRPIMEYVVRLLESYGVTEIGVNLCYFGEKIEQYFGEGKKFGVKFVYVWEKELTGVAGGMRAAANALKPSESFFMIPGDMMVNFDLKSIYKFHKNRGGIATISSYFKPRDPIKDCGVMLFDKKTKLIKRYVEKPQKKGDIISYWTNSGVYVFDPKILQFIPKEINGSKIVDLPRDVFPLILASQEKMYAYPINRNRFYVLGINSEETIKTVEEDIAGGIFKPV